ncbi:acyl-CoA-binding domain-containing protein 6-like [Xenia sp. Carnegie-2017]|uniref:acyl-CoA-binding domain-containing protein 6-like n=1 Tax=Xenia sp. Carnegie-2017 TaxID=2897299 RepID=UPI001F036575|nr:acyl-CoA-binding domain-containing protein 6-like [Xenia sp. Carnegie-2017]XP_046844332.1 acyl-CoA-binding domain-containing protein 6-like [Xenia sp. Carnegie-2017]
MAAKDNYDEQDENNELFSLFKLAAEFVRDLPDLKNAEKLIFYSLYKQATEGRCNTRKPVMWDMKASAKWEAWNGLGEMSSEEAMKRYIGELTRICENWEDSKETLHTIEQVKVSQGSSVDNNGGMGLSVSTLYNAEIEKELNVNDEDKTLFDWCKEGNANKLKKILKQRKNGVMEKDDYGMTLLHWACDRGYENIVQYLIDANCDIDSQDNDGQTALHYATICEFEKIVETLIRAGANATLADKEGNTPFQLTSKTNLQQLLTLSH